MLTYLAFIYNSIMKDNCDSGCYDKTCYIETERYIMYILYLK